MITRKDNKNINMIKKAEFLSMNHLVLELLYVALTAQWISKRKPSRNC